MRESFSSRIERFVVIASKTVADAMPAYDAVVIGSGYGGGVAASRLARMGLRVAVLEQGRLWRPGDFPVSRKARRKATRLTGRAPNLGDPTGLYYLSIGKGLTVFGASGLGGGSLINAGIVLRPDLGRLRNAGWPDAVVGDGLLLEGLARAEAMLGVAPVPAPERFAKFAGMRAGRPQRRGARCSYRQ
ncbi:MAG: FAD-binding protein [Hyphomicrobium sp.]|nr:FAD-binding protein [Hyphomicrobium sp.]